MTGHRETKSARRWMLAGFKWGLVFGPILAVFNVVLTVLLAVYGVDWWFLPLDAYPCFGIMALWFLIGIVAGRFDWRAGALASAIADMISRIPIAVVSAILGSLGFLIPPFGLRPDEVEMMISWLICGESCWPSYAELPLDRSLICMGLATAVAAMLGAFGAVFGDFWARRTQRRGG